MAALLRIIARYPVLAFMVIGPGAGFLTAEIRRLRMRRSCRSDCRCTEFSCRSAPVSLPSWSRPHCPAAPASPTSQTAVCASASQSAGT
jgi:hypothetical protein